MDEATMQQLLSGVTRDGVLNALREFDHLKRKQFLKSTNFGPSNAYFIKQNSGLYDARAIAGYAYRFNTGTPISRHEFSAGDDEKVAHHLEELGFAMLHRPHVDWTRDELILACELAKANGWRQLDENDSRVAELSALLQSPRIHPLGNRHPDFRNASGVACKTGNIADRHPDHRGAQSKGSKRDKEVLDDFLADPDRMHAMAARIRELLTDVDGPDRDDLPDLDTDDDVAGSEGGLALREHLRRERDPKLRRKKLADTRHRGEPIACEVCTFDFGRFYALVDAITSKSTTARRYM